MKTRLLTVGVLVLLGIGAVLFFRMSPSANTPIAPVSSGVKLSSPSPPQPIHDMTTPKVLRIDQLDIESAIEKVGLELNGNMATPPNNTDVGWYAQGTIPGNAGRAVLAAHTGAPEEPAAFRKLETLKQGDVFQIEDTTGQIAEFEIIETAKYTPEDAPRDLIFGPSATARVALITCTGTWIPQQKTYSHRLVIFAIRKA